MCSPSASTFWNDWRSCLSSFDQHKIRESIHPPTHPSTNPPNEGCALIQESRQLHADRFVQNEFKVRKTDDELAAEQLKVTAPPKITFGMFQGDIVAHRRRDGVLEYRVHWQGKPKDEDDWFIRNQLIEEFPDVVVEYERLNGI